MEAVRRPVIAHARHQETRKPLFLLRQHQKRIRHRRRHEPFVAAQPVAAVPGRHGGAGIGAHIRAALLLGHTHAERKPGFFEGRGMRGIVFARCRQRRPFAEKVRRADQGRQRRIRHRDGAQMPRLQLRHEIVAGRANLVPPALFGLTVFPHARMQAQGDRAPHQRMVGRMEFHLIEPVAALVVCFELRRLSICNARQIERFCRPHESAQLLQLLADWLGKILRKLRQQRVAAQRIRAGYRRGLVEHVVRQAELPRWSVPWADCAAFGIKYIAARQMTP